MTEFTKSTKLTLIIFLILHNVRSLHNVGSIFRTADAAGVEKIYLTGYTPGPYDFFGKLRKDFAKTALGAERSVTWEQKKNINSLLKKFKEKGVVTSPPNPLSFIRRGGRLDDIYRKPIFVISLEQSPRAIPYNKLTTIYRSKFKKRNNTLPRYAAIALIVGNEVRGISPNILKKSDAVIEIPMHGKKESLNVAVAVGIALFSLREQLG